MLGVKNIQLAEVFSKLSQQPNDSSSSRSCAQSCVSFDTFGHLHAAVPNAGVQIFFLNIKVGFAVSQCWTSLDMDTLLELMDRQQNTTNLMASPVEKMAS